MHVGGFAFAAQKGHAHTYTHAHTHPCPFTRRAVALLNGAGPFDDPDPSKPPADPNAGQTPYEQLKITVVG